MNKIFLVLALFALSIPSYAYADAYEGPYCYEPPTGGFYSGVADPDHIRGTCKPIEKTLVVSLDPNIAPNYFLGTHSVATGFCDPTGCGYYAKYSEYDFLTSSTSLASVHPASSDYDNGTPDPAYYVLFEKSFFVPILEKAFQNAGLSFSADTMPAVRIGVFMPSELVELKRNELSVADYKYTMNVLFPKLDAQDPWMYIFNTTDYQAYGMHIFAPKSDIAESQYITMEGKNPALSDANFGITNMGGYKGRYVWTVSPTSPLASVKDFWVFTKEGDKLILAWQKSEYVLDNGSVKTVTNADKNISAALLFSKGATPSVSKQQTALTSTSTSTATSTTNVEKKGFFSWIIDTILSWFR